MWCKVLGTQPGDVMPRSTSEPAEGGIKKTCCLP